MKTEAILKAVKAVQSKPILERSINLFGYKSLSIQQKIEARRMLTTKKLY